ncbi:VOC family protein, partial [Vibrio parahaemolyticus]|uniref:VOC family protein n=1 Tax=Vibrio parahaemolyticus TaxID=670 RepID=UPI0015DFD619
MIDHFEIKVAAFEECGAFYMNALEPLGIELKWLDENAAGFGLSSEPNVRFLIEKGVSNSTCHIAFSAGGKCNGKPGLRSHYAPNYYAAFLID